VSTVAEHYEKHLAPIYVWMTGGADAALEAGAAEVEALKLPAARGDLVLDLGSGFGMHAIPLARRGGRVVAIDSSAELLRVLDELRGETPVRTVNDELLAFAQHVAEAPAAILCMGDTVTHLPDFGSVDQLVKRASRALAPGGVLVFSFRDYTRALEGDQRFIPVRSDEDRILMCFLEYEAETVHVHDILHERGTKGWQTRVGSYRKLRLAPESLATRLQANGFGVQREAGPRGMVRLVARRGPR
jgi:SAM-dependent methyltransferase